MYHVLLITALVASLLAGCQASQAPELDPENPTLDAVLAHAEHHPGFIDSYRDNTISLIHFESF